MNNITELNLYLHERRQLESDYYLDSFIKVETDRNKDKEKSNENTMKKRYRLGLKIRRHNIK